MTSSEISDIRAAIRDSQKQTANGFKDLNKRIDPLAESVAGMKQWMDDSNCVRHEKLIGENSKEIGILRLNDVAQSAEVRLKLSMWNYVTIILGSVVVVIPAVIAIINLFRVEGP